MDNTQSRIKRALQKNWQRREQEQWLYGKLGKETGDAMFFKVKGRKNFVYVTVRNASGSQTVVPARNDAGVAHQRMQVKMRLEYGVYVIYGRTDDPNLTVGPPSPPSGVPLHASSHTFGGDDPVSDEDPGANKIPRSQSGGKLHNGWLNTGSGNGIDADLVDGWHADSLRDRVNHNGTQIAATISDFVAGVFSAIMGADSKNPPIDDDYVVITDNADSDIPKRVTFTNIKAFLKTYFDGLYQTVLSGLSAKTTPVDADSFVITDSDASDVGKRVTGTNLKVYLKSYFDGLYGLLAAANSWTDNQSIASGATAGSALSVIRNLTATSTNSPVVNIVQDHASDDQPAMRVRQDRVANGFYAAEFLGGNGIYLESTSPSYPGIRMVRPSSSGDGELAVLGDGFYFQTTQDFAVVTAGVGRIRATAAGLVAIGPITPTTRLSMQAGTSTNDAAVGGVLYITTTTMGNVGAGDDTLASYSLPANTLTVNGQAIRIKAYGTFNVGTIRVKFGGTTIVNLNVISGTDWEVDAFVVRTGATAQKCGGRIHTGGTTYQGHVNYITAAETLSGAVTVSVTGEGTSNNDIVCEMFQVIWNDANT